MLKSILFTVLLLFIGYFLINSLIGKALLLCLVGFVILFIHYSRKIKDKYGISMIVGQIGVGKSSIICSYILKYMQRGWHVYADFETNIPNCRYFNARDLDRFIPEPNSVLFLDEASLVFFSRDFKNFAKYTEFIAKCRHYKTKIFMSSQSFDIDLYIRNRVSSMYLVKRFGCISYMRRIKKLQTVLSAESLSNSSDVKNSGLIDGYQYAGLLEADSIHFFWLPSLWKWHDSFYTERKEPIPYTIPCKAFPEQESFLTKLKKKIPLFAPKAQLASEHCDEVALDVEGNQPAQPAGVDPFEFEFISPDWILDDFIEEESVPRIRH